MAEADKETDAETSTGLGVPEPALSASEWFGSLLSWPRSEPVKATGALLILTGALICFGVYYRAWSSHQIPSPPSRFDGTSSLAQSYCSSLADQASGLAMAHFCFGWELTVTVLIVAAWTLAKVANVSNRMVWIACVSALALLGRGILLRADAASELSVAAVTGRSLEHTLDGNPGPDTPQLMFNTCSRAWAAWVKSRTDSSAIARSALEETVSALKQSESKTTSAAKAETLAAQEKVQTLAAGAVKAKEQVTPQLEQVDGLIANLKKTPNQESNAQALEGIRSSIQASVSNAASNAADVAAAPEIYVLQVGTDPNREEGCATLTNMKRDASAGKRTPAMPLPLARLYVNAGKTQWMTVAGPTTKADAESIRNTISVFRWPPVVRVLPTEWSLENCGKN